MITPSRETVRGWAGSTRAESWVYRPSTLDELRFAIRDSRSRGLSIAHRGSGLSYGDLAINQDGAVIDCSQLNRVVDFDPDTGLITTEPGCTIETVWRTAIAHGWWPAVVPGTMRVSVAGAIACDVHGKNHWTRGTFGDYVRSVETEERRQGGKTARRHDPDLLPPPTSDLQPNRARRQDPNLLPPPTSHHPPSIGSLGLSGTITSATLQLHKVASGFLDVRRVVTKTLAETLEQLDRGAREHEYAVGWIDCFKRGRGVLHFADHLPDGHELTGKGLCEASQRLPSILGRPRPHLTALGRLITNPLSIRGLNSTKWHFGRFGKDRYLQSLAAFHFLLDYVPGWQRAYGRRGFIQYQVFVDREAGIDCFRQMLEAQRRIGLYSYLSVLKRHRESMHDSRYALDGFSLAMDIPVPRNRSKLAALVVEFEAIRADVGGRIYAAKDSVGKGILPDDTDSDYAHDLARRWRD